VSLRLARRQKLLKICRSDIDVIAIVLPNLQGGGAERVALYLANYWAEQGLNVEFVLMDAMGELLELADPRIPIHSLQATRIRDSIWPLRRYLAERQPALVLVGMWPLTSAAIIAWQLAGRPGTLFTTEHTTLCMSCIEELKISPLYLASLLRVTYPLATGVMAVSEGVKQDLCRLGGLSPERVKVIYNPVVRGLIDTKPTEAGLRQQLWGPDFKAHILAVGSFKPAKNFPLLLRAFALLPAGLKAKLTILGEGALRPELEALIEELGLVHHVALPGLCIDTSNWYRTADLFVLSSSWEGFGNVIVEALECGVPVVSTDCRSGPSEILEHGRYGRLVPVGDPEALAHAMQASLLEEHDRDALRRRAQDFAVPAIADHYLAYFLSMGAQL
jgi:glycosyltransferase involved in cell wall biosynthesis